jgi:hypothetical protein
MPQESQLAHRVLSNLALPYITNVSPTSTDPYYCLGSTDILTSINGYAERRPGFATAVETTPTAFNNLQRLFTWDRFDGTFYVMACDVNSSGFAQVYKMQVGVDLSFVSIFTDTVATPFDFVVSNNTVYFSNAHVAKKWDPINNVSNWGISNAIAPVNAYATSGFDGGGIKAWSNPTRFQGAPDASFASNTCISSTAGGTIVTNGLNGTTYGFALSGTSIVVGIQAALTMNISYSGSHLTNLQVNIALVNAGAVIGNTKTFNFRAGFGTTTINFGGASDLWGIPINPTIVNSATFGVRVTCTIKHDSTTISDTATFNVDACQLSIFQSGAPIIAVAAGAGSMSAAAGYVYVTCYGNSATGHISSPTLPSVNTGTFTNKANVVVTLTASTDLQVNQIRVFRTTDGGGGIYFELPTSPYANTSGNVNDASADANLQVGSIAPTPTFNDPPTPLQCPVYFAGRIWGFAGNKVYFSGLEEINQGVPEECFPSGIAGNFWSFDQPVQALAVAGIGANQILGILCGGRVYGITGNTLDTFRRFIISSRRGCRNLTCISALGGMIAWLDSSNMVFGSDGNSVEELSTLVRPDFVNLNPANCSLTFHTAGRFHWLVLSTGTKLYVYDVDQDQWMPPWTFSGKYIFSGETSPGNYVLMASNGTKALQLNPTAFNDNGSTYSPVAQLGLLSVIPDYGTRFSYIGVGSYNEPSRTGYPVTFQVTNNGKAIKDFLICNDEDPTQATYASIVNNLQDTAITFNRPNGTFMQQQVFQTTQPAARWIGMKVVLANLDQTDKLYEMFVAYKPLGGR